MPRNHIYRFVVEGSRNFPVDMLRYDGAYPAANGTPDAVMEMTNALDREYQKAYRTEQGTWPRFRVTLLSSQPPTRDRWSSFGWTVTSEEQL